MRGLITLESMVVVCLVVSYIYILADHNKKELQPDVLREEFTSSVLPSRSVLSSPLTPTPDPSPLTPHPRPRSEVVGSLGADQLSEVMERQAEMIRSVMITSEN